MPGFGFNSGAGFGIGRGFAAGTTQDPEELQRILEDEENSTISNVLRFISRPGFAVRSLLKGDYRAALKNIGQIGLDLPTAGFINRDLNLASIATVFLPEDYEIPEELTRQEERPEFSDVLEAWGFQPAASRGFWERLAIDVGGGIITDPLTLLSGPGKGIASGLGGPLAGDTGRKATETVLSTVGTSAKGQAAIGAMGR